MSLVGLVAPSSGLPVTLDSRARPLSESASRYIGYFAPISRWRARARATLEVSIVIQRRPHCSATYALVPLPHVGSSTKSPGSVHMSMQRSMTLVLVWTT